MEQQPFNKSKNIKIVFTGAGAQGDLFGPRVAVELLADEYPDAEVNFLAPRKALIGLAGKNIIKHNFPSIVDDQLENLDKIGIKKAGNPIYFLSLLQKITSVFKDDSENGFLSQHKELLKNATLVGSNTLTFALDHYLIKQLKKEGFNQDTKHVFLSTHPVVQKFRKSELMFPVLPFNSILFWSRFLAINAVTNKFAIFIERAMMGGNYKKLKRISGSNNKIVVSGKLSEFEETNAHVLLTYPQFLHGDNPADWETKIVQHVGYPYAENDTEDPNTDNILNQIAEAKKEKKKVVLISFGSMSPTNKKEREKMLKKILEIQRLNPEILIIYQDPNLKDKNEEARLREEITKENSQLLYTTDYLNYWKLLPKLDTMVSHFGIGSLQEAFRAGIPTISLAFISEQIWTGNLAKMFGIAKKPHYVNKVKAKKLSNIIRDTLADKRLQENALEMKRRVGKDIEKNGPGRKRLLAALIDILNEPVK